MRTSMAFVNWEKFQRKGGASHVARLSMVVNDFSTMDYLLAYAREEGGPMKAEVRDGLHAYVARATTAHLHEGMLVLEEALAAPSLTTYFGSLSVVSQQSLDLLRQMLPTTCAPEDSALPTDHGRFCKSVAQLRNKIGFHYDKSKTNRALESLAKGEVRGRNTIVERHTRKPRDSRLAFADSIQAVLICQHLWGANPQDDEAVVEAVIEDHLKWIGERLEAFSYVARELCVRFTEYCR